MPSISDKILLLGLGSEILCDAGIGPKLAEEIYSRYNEDKYDLTTSTVGGMDLLHLMKAYKKVIIFDGILSKKIPTGKVNVFTYPDCPESLHLSSGHDADFSMLKEIAGVSGVPFPDEVTIITVSVMDPFTVSDEYSDELKGKYNHILKQTLSNITNLI
jgi:hydrogenase maturation protease